MTPIRQKVSIRPILPPDAPTWERLRKALWAEEDDRHAAEITAYFAGTLSEPVTVLLAEGNDCETLGMVELSLRTDVAGLEGLRTGYVEGLYVVPEVRFRGVARHLLVGSREWARREGCAAFASDRGDRVVVDRSFGKDLP